MAAKLRVKGNRVIEGEYDLPDNFTFREMHTIKRITDLRAGELYPALGRGDLDVVAAFAIIAINRARPGIDAEGIVLDLDIDAIEVVPEESEPEEDDSALPPR